MNFWSNRNVFVTGASGLLGSWLVQELLDNGANVTCLMRDWVPSSRLVSEGHLERVNIVRGELEDYGLLVRVLNEYEIDSVFHLGAQTIVGTANRSALSTFEANVRGTWNLLEACKTNEKLIQRVVVASSDKAYGVHETLPYTEDAPLQGIYPYDVSKSCADLISFSYFHSYGVPVAVTRCGNLFGGGDLNFNRLVPGTIQQALKGEAPIIRSDGTFVRDYFYVRDAVQAYMQLAEAVPGERFTGQAFNFGTETPVSVVDLVDVILQTMGRQDLKPVILNEASNEIPKQYLDCAKARTMLSWAPTYSLEQGLSETISWYSKHLGYEPATSAAGVN
ncbi:MAG: GDP-mannose 4,6-dehydratase [Chloroflexi bacterium]|nr:GDP-mannose 4,6-dehydratase [Chloroflexota bacterium]